MVMIRDGLKRLRNRVIEACFALLCRNKGIDLDSCILVRLTAEWGRVVRVLQLAEDTMIRNQTIDATKLAEPMVITIGQSNTAVRSSIVQISRHVA